MAMQAWETNLKRMNDTFASLTDEQMMADIVPGRNRPLYLLGHMAAVHDRMLPLLGLGERKMEHLDNAFLINPDKAVVELPSIAELRAHYAEANESINRQMGLLRGDEWFEKHTSVSEEDFAKEPHRNKLSILNSRAHHVSYHLGQLMMAKNK